MAELHPGIEPLVPYLNGWGMTHQKEVLEASGYYALEEVRYALREANSQRMKMIEYAELLKARLDDIEAALPEANYTVVPPPGLRVKPAEAPMVEAE